MGLVDCPSCHPASFPREYVDALPRQNEGHLSLRFGDHMTPYKPGGMRVERLTVGGEDVLTDAVECMAGEAGWVVANGILLGTPTRCPTCMTRLMKHIMYGRVQVEATMT